MTPYNLVAVRPLHSLEFIITVIFSILFFFFRFDNLSFFLSLMASKRNHFNPMPDFSNSVISVFHLYHSNRINFLWSDRELVQMFDSRTQTENRANESQYMDTCHN